MKKYKNTIIQQVVKTYHIKANNKDEALDKACDGDFSDSVETDFGDWEVDSVVKIKGETK